MYLSGVNRGILFTKPGFYTTGMALLLGLLATGSGYNGLFLALGFGLSVLIVSGLLSERTVQFSRVEALGPLVVDAGFPFRVGFRVRNESRDWFAFGLEAALYDGAPKLRLLPREYPSLAQSKPVHLPPGGSTEADGFGAALPRGIYANLFLLQRTRYPFGLIVKFKADRTTLKLVAVPAPDEGLLEQLRHERLQRASESAADAVFHSHRLRQPGDAARQIDWRKSAGHKPEDWIVKRYESERRREGIQIVPEGKPIDVELFLRRLRAGVELASHEGLPVALGPAVGREAALEWLAGYSHPDQAYAPAEGFHVLRISEGAHAWED